jgi:MerR family copper efflux transcriptional regulator
MTLTIGGLAKRSGVSIQTLRYYERRTLLSTPERSPSGYRQYPEDEVQRVEFIRRAKGLGFTLEEIGKLLSLRVLAGGRCGGVEKAAQMTQRRVHERLEQLARLDSTLTRLIQNCKHGRATDHCPILDALETEKT